MNQYKNPTWWTTENDSSWERVKAAFKRDWDQTKHDFGGQQADTDQDVDDTVKQAAGKQAIPPRGVPVYENAEPAYRFGYGARAHYGKKYPTWTPDLEQELRKDWGGLNGGSDWAEYSPYIRKGWDYKP